MKTTIRVHCYDKTITIPCIVIGKDVVQQPDGTLEWNYDNQDAIDWMVEHYTAAGFDSDDVTKIEVV